MAHTQSNSSHSGGDGPLSSYDLALVGERIQNTFHQIMSVLLQSYSRDRGDTVAGSYHFSLAHHGLGYHCPPTVGAGGGSVILAYYRALEKSSHTRGGSEFRPRDSVGLDRLLSLVSRSSRKPDEIQGALHYDTVVPILTRMGESMVRGHAHCGLYDALRELNCVLSNMQQRDPHGFHAYADLVCALNSPAPINHRWILQLIASLSSCRWESLPAKDRALFCHTLGENTVRAIVDNELTPILLAEGYGGGMLLNAGLLFPLLRILYPMMRGMERRGRLSEETSLSQIDCFYGREYPVLTGLMELGEGEECDRPCLALMLSRYHGDAREENCQRNMDRYRCQLRRRNLSDKVAYLHRV